MKDLLEREAPSLPPLQFVQRPIDARVAQADAVFEVRWGPRAFTFVADFKARSTPQALSAAAQQAKGYAFDVPGAHPLIVVPYLGPAQLDEVSSLGVSAVDLCGNGFVRIDDQLLVSRSGRPNLYRGSEPLKTVYRGTASLVARAFVLRRTFSRVSEIRDLILARGGSITLATVSKALGRLQEDLIIAREGRGAEVIQPGKLLDKLRENHRSPRVLSRWSGTISMGPEDLDRRLAIAADAEQRRLVQTGLSSASRYVVMASEPVSTFYYAGRAEDLIRAARLEPSGRSSFPNIEVLQTDDATVFFDARTQEGRRLASPLQVWLELGAGDKRTREVAAQLMERLLSEDLVLGASRDA